VNTGIGVQQAFLPGLEPPLEVSKAPLALRAVVRGFNAASHTATVQPLGSAATYLHDVKVSLEVASLDAGERVLVLMPDEHNAGEAVVICRYGGSSG